MWIPRGPKVFRLTHSGSDGCVTNFNMHEVAWGLGKVPVQCLRVWGADKGKILHLPVRILVMPVLLAHGLVRRVSEPFPAAPGALAPWSGRTLVAYIRVFGPSLTESVKWRGTEKERRPRHE